MLKAKIAHGAAWMLLSRMLDRGLGLVSTFVLARLLVPADFGLVAMAMSVIALIELASAFGLDVPLIQRAEEPTRDHYDTAWTLNLLLAVGCALATAALAYPSAVFYEEPRLAVVMLVLAVGWSLQGLENIGVVSFRRSMQFNREAFFLLGKRLAGFTVGLMVAVWLRSYWALVAGMVAGRLTGVALSYLIHPYRPRFSLRARAELFSLSVWLFVNNLLRFGTARVSHFIVGRSYGAPTLGAYAIGAEFAYLPHTELIAPVNRAVFSGYSRMAADSRQMRSGFIDVNAFIAALALPASAGIAALAEPFVFALLGAKWAEAVPVLQILAFAGAGRALMSNTYSANLALGKPQVPTIALTIELLVLVPGMIFLPALLGVKGIAYAELVAVGVGTVCSYPVLFYTLKISWMSYISNLWRPAVAAALMAVGVSSLRTSLSGIVSHINILLIGIVSGVVIYGATLLVLWLLSGRPPGAERHLIAYVMSWMRRSLRPATER